MSLRPACAKLAGSQAVAKRGGNWSEERDFKLNEMWSVIVINDKATKNIAKHSISIILKQPQARPGGACL